MISRYDAAKIYFLVLQEGIFHFQARCLFLTLMCMNY